MVIIGVGHYPHLPGGKGKPQFAGHDGTGQLKSPPESARAIARWLIESYEHPTKPLASVSLLLSDASSQSFSFVSGGKKRTAKVPLAEMKNVAAAITEWHDRGNENPDHLLLFFFCGHGIAAGLELSLLLRDFGAIKTAPLNGAIAFNLLRQNMDECQAARAVLFRQAQDRYLSM